ncbi:MAG: phytanoyl-CoA dioxygenase family protein [Gammaproteobacteria bacterium]|nr:phytanoyl-CoA dioxygenase family protein [Gammaproteobacteria bacterium]
MLTNEQLERFDQDGFLVIEDVVRDEDLFPLEQEYNDLLDGLSRKLYKEGRIPSAYPGLPFGERFARVVSHYPDSIDCFNISLPLVNGKVDASSYHAHTGPAVFGLLRNRRILDIVECVIGPEIASSPVQQMRLKPPQRKLSGSNLAHSGVGLTTWHQDTVAVLPEAEDTNQLTVWIAVTDASEENGCLVSIPGSHREGAHRHVPGRIPREPTIPASVINNRKGVALPVQRGGVIIFHKQNIHSSLPNLSDQLRWSVDIRYHPVGQPSGRPAFPGFVARSPSDPKSELKDPLRWARMWENSRQRIIRGEYRGPIFTDWEDTRSGW